MRQNWQNSRAFIWLVSSYPAGSVNTKDSNPSCLAFRFIISTQASLLPPIRIATAMAASLPDVTISPVRSSFIVILCPALMYIREER